MKKVSTNFKIFYICAITFSILLHVSDCSIIKYQPNTLLEFRSLKCEGNYDREQYMILNQICDECYNLFRQPRILTECRSSCFRNLIFPICTAYLSIDHRKEEIEKKINYANGL